MNFAYAAAAQNHLASQMHAWNGNSPLVQQAGLARREGERGWSEQAGVSDEGDESMDRPESHAFGLWAAQALGTQQVGGRRGGRGGRTAMGVLPRGGPHPRGGRGFAAQGGGGAGRTASLLLLHGAKAGMQPSSGCVASVGAERSRGSNGRCDGSASSCACGLQPSGVAHARDDGFELPPVPMQQQQQPLLQQQQPLLQQQQSQPQGQGQEQQQMQQAVALSAAFANTTKLHDEILRYTRQSIEAAHSGSHETVLTIMGSLQSVVNARWPHASVELYGSRSTGLYLSTSDMDVTILNVTSSPKEVGDALRHLQDELAPLPWVHRMKLVLGTRIPVLKIESHAGVPVDVTISDSLQHTGLLARDLVLSYLAEAPQLAPLVLVLKTFLRERGLNDPYTGGMSSYSLVVLLWSFCVESHQRGFNVHDVGYMLVGFLQHFLYRFEAQVTHVDDPLGMRYSEDGTVIGDNILHSCYQIGRVCRSFRKALAVLNSPDMPWETGDGPFLPRLLNEVDGKDEGPIHAVTQTDAPNAEQSLKSGAKQPNASQTEGESRGAEPGSRAVAATAAAATAAAASAAAGGTAAQAAQAGAAAAAAAAAAHQDAPALPQSSSPAQSDATHATIAPSVPTKADPAAPAEVLADVPGDGHAAVAFCLTAGDADARASAVPAACEYASADVAAQGAAALPVTAPPTQDGPTALRPADAPHTDTLESTAIAQSSVVS